MHWLNNCETNHAHTCTTDSRNKDAILIVLIKILDHRLVSTTLSDRYFTLSYV